MTGNRAADAHLYPRRMPRIPCRALRRIAGCLLPVLVIAAAFPALAAGQDPGTTQLQPGANEIFWRGQPATPAGLFEDSQRLEAIWMLDDASGDWLAAGRDVPPALWTLARIEPFDDLVLYFSEGSFVTWPPVWLVGPYIGPGLSGRLLDLAGRPVDGALITALNPDTGPIYAYTLADGEVRLNVPGEGGYLITIERPGDCPVYLTRDGFTIDRRYQQPIPIQSGRIIRDIRIPARACSATVSGVITSDGSASINDAGVSFDLADADPAVAFSTRPRADGSYSLRLPAPATYSITLEWPARRCSVSIQHDNAAVLLGHAEPFEIPAEDVHRDIRIPAGTCEHSIAVDIVFESGAIPRSLDLSACLPINGTKHCIDLPWQNELSEYRAIVPIEGEYELTISPGSSPANTYLTLGSDRLAPVPIFGSDATDIIIRALPALPETPAE